VRARSRSSFDILSISALDLFASALGAFMLLALMMFPYWQKQPALRAEAAAAQARLAGAEQAKSAAEQAIAAARERQEQAAAALALATDRLAGAEAEAEAAERAAAQAAGDQAKLRAEAEAAAKAAAAAPKPVASPRKTGIGIDDLDLVVVMDTTGSMRDEVADVQASLLGIIRVLDRLSPSLRVGFVAYKDRGDEYVTRTFPLAPVGGRDARGILSFVRELTVGGGGDDPEAVEEAVAAAVAMPWRAGVQGRILVVGDAGTRPDGSARAYELARQFRARAARHSISAILTGGTPADRLFFQRLAETGGGDFSEYQGAMIESVLLSVLENARRAT
jgi:von Willebrand factor type A domain